MGPGINDRLVFGLVVIHQVVSIGRGLVDFGTCRALELVESKRTKFGERRDFFSTPKDI